MGKGALFWHLNCVSDGSISPGGDGVIVRFFETMTIK